MSETRTVLRRLARDEEVSQLTLRQTAILALIAEAGGTLDYGRVVLELLASKPAITRAADRLVSDQLLERRSHPGDPRKVFLMLTERGQAFAAERLA